MKQVWHQITVGDLGKVVTGNTPPKNDPENYGGSYPFIKPTDMVKDQRYVFDYEETYSEKAFKKFKNAYIPPFSTGVVTIGTVGEKLFLSNEWCFTNQSVNVIIPDEEKYDKMFVYYLMKYNLPKVAKANPGTASGRHHVSKSNFCSIQIEVPPLLQQQKIASILSAYDDLIENNRHRIAILEEMARNLYREWFVKFRFPGHEEVKIVDSELGQIPEGWKVVSLVDIADFLNGLAMQKYRPTSEEFLPVIKIRELRQGFTESTEKARIDLAQKYIVNNGDILFSWSGSLECVLWASGKGALNQHLFKVTPKIYTKWFSYFSIHTHLEYFRQIAAMKAISMGHINREHLQRARTLLPNQEVILQADASMNIIFNQIVNLSKRNQNLKTQRDMLLPKLISGKIPVI